MSLSSGDCRDRIRPIRARTMVVLKRGADCRVSLRQASLGWVAAAVIAYGQGEEALARHARRLHSREGNC